MSDDLHQAGFSHRVNMVKWENRQRIICAMLQSELIARITYIMDNDPDHYLMDPDKNSYLVHIFRRWTNSDSNFHVLH
jgi:hypothetical protein